jgi:hypothetical protein
MMKYPTKAPIICIAINAGTLLGSIPANELLNERAILTAGFARLVDEVKKYAPVIQAATVNGTRFDLFARIVPQITRSKPTVATTSDT